MALIMRDCISMKHKTLLKVLIGIILMSTKRIGICEIWVNLQCALEELDGCLMLLLQREAVTHDTPSLRRKAID